MTNRETAPPCVLLRLLLTPRQLLPPSLPHHRDSTTYSSDQTCYRCYHRRPRLTVHRYPRPNRVKPLPASSHAVTGRMLVAGDHDPRGRNMATLDPPLNLLRDQILAATTLRREEIGWIAGASHRQSGPHFPEYPPPPGNPPYEVDAIDPPHDPARGADMAVLTEALRQSRDPRIKLVIFNRRIFSSYDHAEGDPFTWRPYREEDPHTGHAHIERTDTRRDDLRPWQIGLDVTPEQIQAACLKAIHQAVDIAANRSNATGRQIGDDLAALFAPLATKLDAIAAAVAELEDDGMTQAELDTFADAVAARLTPLQAAQLANALTLRFAPTPS